MTAKQCAEYLGVSHQSVYQAARLGRLIVERVGGRCVFDRASVVLYKRTRRQAFRPRLK